MMVNILTIFIFSKLDKTQIKFDQLSYESFRLD